MPLRQSRTTYQVHYNRNVIKVYFVSLENVDLKTDKNENHVNSVPNPNLAKTTSTSTETDSLTLMTTTAAALSASSRVSHSM